MNTLHLVVTSLCDRNCQWCCNKQYDIKNLQYASDEDFRWAEMLCLTGGEPFAYSNPCNLAGFYKHKYDNIKHVIVYSNSLELAEYLFNGGRIRFIDGVNVSIKSDDDLGCLRAVIPHIHSLPMNRIYDFTGRAKEVLEAMGVGNRFEVINREWQKNFVPAENCRFKRGN